jgi:hypothetical protein
MVVSTESRLERVAQERRRKERTESTERRIEGEREELVLISL